MQSTGHSSTHALSFTSIQGSAITYAIPGTFQSSGRPTPNLRASADACEETTRVREAQAQAMVVFRASWLADQAPTGRASQDHAGRVGMLRSAGTKLTTAAVG